MNAGVSPKMTKVMVLMPMYTFLCSCSEQSHLPCSSRNFSTSMAAMQPVPAAVMACL